MSPPVPGDWRVNTICNNNVFSVLFSVICAFGYARLGTWGWRISLLKVWQLIITLFNASFESLISNCLQEPIHGTLWKRHTKRVDLLSFSPPFLHDLCLIIIQTYESKRINNLSILSNNMFLYLRMQTISLRGHNKLVLAMIILCPEL